MRTGPLRRETSRQRSSVLISLSAVYENTWATVQETKQGCDYSSSRIHEMEITEAFIFHLVSTHAMTVEKAYFLILFPPHVVHTLVGLYISDLEGKKATFQPIAKTKNTDPPSIDINLRRGLFNHWLTKPFLIMKRVNEAIMTPGPSHQWLFMLDDCRLI